MYQLEYSRVYKEDGISYFDASNIGLRTIQDLKDLIYPKKYYIVQCKLTMYIIIDKLIHIYTCKFKELLNNISNTKRQKVNLVISGLRLLTCIT